MNEYNRVREEIAELLTEDCTNEEGNCSQSAKTKCKYCIADQILSNPSILIKADDQKPPKWDYELYLISASDVEFVQQRMFEAKFIKTVDKLGED